MPQYLLTQEEYDALNAQRVAVDEVIRVMGQKFTEKLQRCRFGSMSSLDDNARQIQFAWAGAKQAAEEELLPKTKTTKI